MGTIVTARHLSRISDMVSRSSGKVVLGGTHMTGFSPLDGIDLSKGAFFAPTIVTDVDSSDELWREEVFGPVVVVRKFIVRLPEWSL